MLTRIFTHHRAETQRNNSDQEEEEFEPEFILTLMRDERDIGGHNRHHFGNQHMCAKGGQGENHISEN